MMLIHNPILTNSSKEAQVQWAVESPVLKKLYSESFCQLVEYYDSKRQAQKACIKKNKVWGDDFFKIHEVLVIGNEVRDIKYVGEKSRN